MTFVQIPNGDYVYKKSNGNTMLFIYPKWYKGIIKCGSLYIGSSIINVPKKIIGKKVIIKLEIVK